MEPALAAKLTVAVMTYNRPAHLQNCLASVRRHLPGAPVLVMDDASDDPAQISLLDEARTLADVRVIVASGKAGFHGGLYGNMQHALAECQTQFLLYLQDDTQLVRSPNATDLDHVAQALAPKDAAFVYPFFIKSAKKRAGWAVTSGNLPGFAQFRSRAGTLRPWNYYADICICDCETLRAADWRFQPSEAANGKQAEALFQPMEWLIAPWGFYCPEVPIFRWRARSRSLAQRILPPRVREAAFFHDMDADAVTRLRNRPPHALPFAEDYLTTTRKVRRPFVYQDVKSTRLSHLVWTLESKLFKR
ncbi:MAG: glycosyltransferase family 2 protein [Rhodobacteraceae bacterium]|nr:glycosyltransferase family 2 protein [Paracoccaceae bacterium]